MVFNGMSIGQEPALVIAPINHEACAVGRHLPVALPGQGKVWPAVHAVHLHHSRHRQRLQARGLMPSSHHAGCSMQVRSLSTHWRKGWMPSSQSEPGADQGHGRWRKSRCHTHSCASMPTDMPPKYNIGCKKIGLLMSGTFLRIDEPYQIVAFAGAISSIPGARHKLLQD